MELKNKNILIVGLGKSGIGAMMVLKTLGARISVTDKNDKNFFQEDLLTFMDANRVRFYPVHAPENLQLFHLIVVSPGVPLELPFLQKAKELNIEIIGELELAYRVGCGRYVAITGTNGKTTTTSLVGKIFSDSGRSTYVVGNIGISVASVAMETKPEDWLITETSSFQLETIESFKPEISAVLNVTPDHLDRHKSFENYLEAKSRIFKNQTQENFLILNKDDPNFEKLARISMAQVIPFSRNSSPIPGAFVKNDKLIIADLQGKEHEICKLQDLQILGGHNVENALAAAAISFFAGIDPKSIGDSITKFMGVEHRLEKVGQHNGVWFINDSKGTNTDAAIKALDAMEKEVILIAGGYDKGADFTDFIKAFDNKVEHLILLGKTAEKIKKTASALGFNNITLCQDMKECVETSIKVAKPGYTVLLSPACASWDMYSNFEQRGRHFKECVENLRR